MKGDLPPDQAAQFVSDTTKTIEVDETELARSAPMASMLGREVISTLREPLERFHDWVRLRDFTGWSNFIVVPLLNTDGAFGTFNVTFSYTIQEEDVDWVGQLGAVISAHLTSMAARDALRDLNRTLEERVEDRTQALRASQERFTALFNYAPQAMLIVDGDGRLVQFNRGALRLLRATEQELANTTVNDLIPPNLRDSHRLLMRGFMQQENPGPMAPNRIVQAMRPDGTVFLADIGLVPIHINEQPLVVVGISDTTERVEAQRSIERSLKEKETLLKEIHHRVKNNLQIISSLLMLQCEQMPAEEVRVALMDSVLRVRSMALIHQQLYGVESLAKIDFGDYARTLAESLRSVLAPRARLQVTADLVEVTIGTAVPLGLILNELLTNAFKYGVPEHSTRTPGRTGPLLDVSVEVRTIGDEVSLAVIDSGPGMPENFDIERSRSLGLQLIRSLRRQLRGRFSYDSDRGSRFEIICPAAARE
jgi:PAS domain S-box-containing protein